MPSAVLGIRMSLNPGILQKARSGLGCSPSFNAASGSSAGFSGRIVFGSLTIVLMC